MLYVNESTDKKNYITGVSFILAKLRYPIK